MARVKSIILSGFKDNNNVKLNYSNKGDENIDIIDDTDKID
jgi:hypothetical protein